MRIILNQIEKIRGWWRFVDLLLWRCRWQHKIIIVVVFEEIKKRTDVGMSFDNFPLNPLVFTAVWLLQSRYGESLRIPGSTGW